MSTLLGIDTRLAFSESIGITAIWCQAVSSETSTSRDVCDFKWCDSS